MVEETIPSDHISNLYTLDGFGAAYMVFAGLVAFIVVFGISRIGRRKKELVAPEPITHTPHDLLNEQLLRALSGDSIPTTSWGIGDDWMRAFYNDASIEIRFFKEKEVFDMSSWVSEIEVNNNKIWKQFCTPPGVSKKVARDRCKKIERLALDLFEKVKKVKANKSFSDSAYHLSKMTNA